MRRRGSAGSSGTEKEVVLTPSQIRLKEMKKKVRIHQKYACLSLSHRDILTRTLSLTPIPLRLELLSTTSTSKA